MRKDRGTDGQTDMTKPTVAVRNFANALQTDFKSLHSCKFIGLVYVAQSWFLT
jgi:hypothetical protein